MKAVLIDDNEEFHWTFQKALEMETERADFPIDLTCRSSLEDIGWEEADDIDLFFIDIELGGVSGIDLAMGLQKRSPGKEIVFVSAYDQYMQKSMLARPRFFVCKVNLEKDLRDVVMFLKRQWQQRHASVKVIWKGGGTEIYPQRILWCESQGHYVDIYLDDGRKAVLRTGLRQLAALFSDFHYLRIHNRRIVNLEYVRRFEGSQVVLKDGTALGVSRNCQREVDKGIREWFESLYQQS
jgi:DNA-binding LytR/AlgR family response regulator|nr:LytTR family DNA-binding domain-containing protein [uncultured Acetatifactor sp.]